MAADFKAFLDQITKITVSNITDVQDAGPAAAGDVWVGRMPGNHVDGAAEPFLVLNNKLKSAQLGGPYASVSRMLWEGDQQNRLQKTWSQCPATPAAPQAVLDNIRLVVEDASADSVLGVILLLAHLAEVPLPAELAPWIAAADEWEMTGNAENPETSWCVLGSALAHAQFPVGRQVGGSHYARAWTAMFHFTAACLASGDAPNEISAKSDSPALKLARAALNQEKQAYLAWLDHAKILQLALPMAGIADRWLMVDALFFTEDQPTGGAKAFYRNDKDKAPLKAGFTLAVHYREAATPGNRVTIAVDVRPGVHLRPVWDELERRETDAWRAAGQNRPNGKPRVLPNVPGHTDWVDQPWYLNENASLIGDPYKDSSGQGSRLSWEEVQAAIWTICNPLRGVRVRCGITDQTIPILDLHPAPAGKNLHDRSITKYLLLAHWADGSSEPGTRALPDVETADRMLAALVNRGRDAAVPLPSALPQRGSWDRVGLRGGFAIVTESGAFVLNDWRDEQLDLAPIQEMFDRIVDFDLELRDIHDKKFRPLASEAHQASSQRRRQGELTKLLQRATDLLADLATLRGSLATPPADESARVLWDAINTRWQFTERAETLQAQLTAIKESLEAATVGKTTQSITTVVFYFGALLTECRNLRPGRPVSLCPIGAWTGRIEWFCTDQLCFSFGSGFTHFVAGYLVSRQAVRLLRNGDMASLQRRPS